MTSNISGLRRHFHPFLLLCRTGLLIRQNRHREVQEQAARCAITGDLAGLDFGGIAEITEAAIARLGV